MLGLSTGLGLRPGRPFCLSRTFSSSSPSSRLFSHLVFAQRHSRQSLLVTPPRRLLFQNLFQKRTVIPPLVLANIKRLESAVDTDPNNAQAQAELFKLLLSTQTKAGYNNVMTRWERMCEFNPSSPLLRSDEAFRNYLIALVNSGLASSVNHAAQRRDALLKEQSAITTPIPNQNPVTNAADASPTVDANSPASTAQSVSSASIGIAQEVLTATAKSSTISLGSGVNGTINPDTQGQLAQAIAAGAGGVANPIHVQLSEPRSVTWRKAIRTTFGFLFFGFAMLVVTAMLLEQSNLLKTGPRASEFEPMEGKIVKFSDVHGVDEAKDELQEVVEFLKDPNSFTTLGGKLPKGILLTGPPGTGKTLLARAVAGEAGVPFLFASGSEFEEVFVGVGAKRVRDLFAAARKKQPAIIFIDELDAIGGKRSNRDQQYLKQTLNQLLVEMDGFVQSEGVIVIAATNFPESLDQALVRPGRFDRIIAVPLPDVRGRVQILQHHMRNVITAKDVDPTILARGTPGFSGADLQNMVNQAAVQAAKDGSKEVDLRHFEWAKDRIIMGAERRTHYIDPKVKKMTAYHEGGHALLALYTDGAMPLHKVTCVTRGHALGLTQQLPQDDRVSVSKKEYLAEIDVSMGGRAAEELIYGEDNVTSGCISDLRYATRVATQMVRNYGYSERVGPVFYSENDNISPQRREVIESEIQRLLLEGQNRAMEVLRSKEEELHRLAEALVEYETLDLEEVKKVIKGERIRPVEERLQEAAQMVLEPPAATSQEQPTPQQLVS